MLNTLGRKLATFLTSPSRRAHSTSPPTNLLALEKVLRPGDVLLIEGNSRVSTAIKYLTQSTWSHAALFVDDRLHTQGTSGAPLQFIEADAVDGVRIVELNAFRGYNCRICRPVGLAKDEVERVIAFAAKRVGYKYDLKNIVDLLRFLIPTPPVPVRWRRRMIALGSGDPTRAICSTVIAQAFQSIRYPILPDTTTVKTATVECPGCVEEILRIRHHSLYVPRDFDVSPYFEIVKPSLNGFDFRGLHWAS